MLEGLKLTEFKSIKWEYDPSYRSCTRVLAESPIFARTIWKRLTPFLKTIMIQNDMKPYGTNSQGSWIPIGINPCIRYTKY